jgi:hypothetical protein
VTQQRKPGDNFEERLLAHLKAEVAERGVAAAGVPTTPAWRRRTPRLVLGAAGATASVAAVLVFSAGGGNTSRAFAVEPQDGGGVMVKVYSLEEASGLEEALKDAGIQAQVSWLPTGMACREPHYTPSHVQLPGGGTQGNMGFEGPSTSGLTFGVGSTQQWRERFNQYMRGEISEDELANSVPSLNFDPAAFGPDQSVVISGAPVPYAGDPEGGFEARFEIAKGPVEPCEPVPYHRTGESILRSSGGGG